MRLCQIDNGGLTNKSADDTAVFNAALSDGILNGFEITYSGGVIYISPGRVLCGGRVVAVDAIEEVLAALVPNGELIVSIDLDGNPPASFVTRAPQPLIQEDTRVSGTKYELQLATYTTNGTYITDLEKTVSNSTTNSSTLGAAENLPVFTGQNGELVAIDTKAARANLGLQLSGYILNKTSATDSLNVLKANWSTLEEGAGLMYVRGNIYGPSDGFFYFKSNDRNGAAFRIGYSLTEPAYYTLLNGAWNK